MARSETAAAAQPYFAVTEEVQPNWLCLPRTGPSWQPNTAANRHRSNRATSPEIPAAGGQPDSRSATARLNIDGGRAGFPKTAHEPAGLNEPTHPQQRAAPLADRQPAGTHWADITSRVVRIREAPSPSPGKSPRPLPFPRKITVGVRRVDVMDR